MNISLPQLSGSHLITHSRMQSRRMCPRKHLFAYELGWRPDGDSKALVIGKAFHNSAEMIATGQSDARASSLAWNAVNAELGEHLAYAIGALVLGYADAWRNSVETVAAELSFEVKIRDPKTGRAMRSVRAAGKIDRIVRLSDGRLAILETKTVSEDIGPDSKYWDKLEIDQQISHYMLAARELGYEVETVIYDAVRKPTMSPIAVPELDENGDKIVVRSDTGERVYNANGKPRQTASTADGFTLLSREETPQEYGQRIRDDIRSRPEFYYARREIPRLDSDIDDYRVELHQQAKDIARARREGIHYRNTAACSWMGRCPYLSICRNAEIGDTVPQGFVQVQDIHQELSE